MPWMRQGGGLIFGAPCGQSPPRIPKRGSTEEPLENESFRLGLGLQQVCRPLISAPKTHRGGSLAKLAHSG